MTRPDKHGEITRDEKGRLLPGRSLNPSGRPPVGQSLAELVRKVGAEAAGASGLSKIEAVVRRAYVDAVSGNAKARAWLADRGWGKVKQPLAIEDWRKEAEAAGIDVTAEFELMVQRHIAEMQEKDGEETGEAQDGEPEGDDEKPAQDGEGKPGDDGGAGEG